MMYRVEFIFKESVIQDAHMNWGKMGKSTKNICDGGFIFDVDTHPIIENGIIRIFVDNHQYIYTISDFYRIKITQGE